MEKPLTEWTPVEIDTELARIWGKIYQVQARLMSTRQSLSYDFIRRNPARVEEYEARAAEYEAELDDLYVECLPYEDEYRRRPWLRYYLVQNNNGHVHREMHCTTCFDTTQYAWLIELADCDEDKMVEEWGERACTVCFPNAPANPNYSRPSRLDREAQEARAKEKAEREAKKALKNLRPEEQFPDGRSDRVRPGFDWGGSLVTTVAGAKQAIRDAIELANYSGPGHRHPWADAAEKAAEMATAVLLARGVTQAELDKIVANAKKKNGVK